MLHVVLCLLSIYASNKKVQWATFREWKVCPEEFNKKRDLDGLQTFSASETFFRMINHKGLSFSLFLSLSLSLFRCLLSFSSHEPWLSIVRDYGSIAGLRPVEDLLLIFICIWNKPILSCRRAAEPCGPFTCIYNIHWHTHRGSVCVPVLWIYSMCRTVLLLMCVYVLVHFGTNRLTLWCPRPPEPLLKHQNTMSGVSHQGCWCFSSRLNRTLRLEGLRGVTMGALNMQTSVEPGSQSYRGTDIPLVERAEGD